MSTNNPNPPPSCPWVPLPATDVADQLDNLRNRLTHVDAVPEELKAQVLHALDNLNFLPGTEAQKDLIKARYVELLKLCLERGILPADGGRIKSRQRLSRFFHFLGLSSRILPLGVRLEVFEPAFNDLKSDYLTARRRYKTKFSRRWLGLCFGFHVCRIIVQCLWGSCSETVKRVLLNLLPDIFRRLFGS